MLQTCNALLYKKRGVNLLFHSSKEKSIIDSSIKITMYFRRLITSRHAHEASAASSMQTREPPQVCVLPSNRVPC